MTAGGRRKAVLFLDDKAQQGTLFDPFAATLQRRGFHTVRLTLDRPGLARVVRDTLFYSRVVQLTADDAGNAIRRLCSAYDVVDVQLGEATLARLGLASKVVTDLAEAALACTTSAPTLTFDKFELNAQLGGSGVPAPPQILASQCDAEVAAEKLGLPLVLKRRTAEGGRGVHVAERAADAEKALSAWRVPRADVFFQKYIPGELVMYGSVIGETGPLIERCFRATKLQKRWGPSAQVVMYDDAQAARAGQAICGALGLRGLVQFDFIRDGAGQLWHIDANVRCWGSMLGANAEGADFVAAYDDLVSGRAATRSARQVDDRVFSIEPHTLLAVARTGSFQALSAEWREFSRFCRLGPGPWYLALLSVKAAAIASGRIAPSRRAPQAA